MAKTLVDAGPLVAIFLTAEPHYVECVQRLRREPGPLITVWPVITEAMHLLGQWPRAQEALLDMVESGVLELAALDRVDTPRIRALMKKYADQPMDLADAGLVRVAEREHLSRILTLDRRDFTIYRIGRLGRFEVVP